ncbi:hypothetical protein NEICINOT_03139 [Neisseria cinerea ATCC 14685]|uniref:Uncharacterized protein n=1 Tax=Neisseria cinerea ATCC 14685 TaxID=546262 RepID=D0W0H2_NEICI|nr:hypothetical protein NEICINOT_03139 [Neisseria cinerea ATCC 14685]
MLGQAFFMAVESVLSARDGFFADETAHRVALCAFRIWKPEY